MNFNVNILKMPFRKRSINSNVCCRLARHWAVGICLVALPLLAAQPCFAQSSDRDEPTSDPAVSTSDMLGVQSKAIAKIKGLPASSTTKGSPAVIDTNRIKLINDRIQLLKSLIDEENTAAEEQAISRRPRLDSEPKAPQPPAQVRQDQTTPPEKFVPSIDPNSPVADVPGQQVVTEPVNTLELGYSLYMTGNYSAANRNFQTLLDQKLSPDETAWVHCLLGCGYRIQRDYYKAEKMYRKAGSEKKASPFTTKYANWGLRYIESRQDAIQSMKVVSTELDKLIEEIKDARR
jgi:TolA-binding protein